MFISELQESEKGYLEEISPKARFLLIKKLKKINPGVSKILIIQYDPHIYATEKKA